VKVDKNHAARRLFHQESFGVLSTNSLDLPGYPFGSVTPYCADAAGEPIIYISRIAQHTKNIQADRRLSLTVVDSASNSNDVQARGRLTLIGDGVPVESHVSGISERYFRYFPEARQYEQTHDFLFFRIELVRIRFIGGFGRIHWIDPDDFRLANPFSAIQESRIVGHMNDDHAAALRHYTGGGAATMTGIDSDGFDVLVEGRKRRITFDRPVHTMEEAREALVAMSKR
jgi:heme iron utilization protein